MTKAFSDIEDMFEGCDFEKDSMEAIFELNLGDFVTEHLISKDLAKKISTSAQDKVPKIKNQLKELISIYSVDNTLSLLGFNSDEDFVIYNSIAKTMTQMLDMDACHIYLNKGHLKSDFEKDLVMVGTSLDNMGLDRIHSFGYMLEETTPQVQSFVERKSFHLKNKSELSCIKIEKELNQDKVSTMLIVPLSSNTGDAGIMCLESYKEKEILFEYIKLVEITARIFVTSMNLQKLVEETQSLINKEDVTLSELTQQRAELTAIIGDISDEQQVFVEALADAADIKGHHEKEHCRKVANCAREIARYLELNEKTNDLIYYAGLLQNIGKIALSEDIFTKKEKLTKEEWQKLKNHPNVGVSLLMNINFLSEIIPYIHYHKERWDGQGEPEGLAGKSIPFGSRIIAVADAYQAMISERPYREPMPKEKAISIVKEEAEVKWDPIVVDALEHLELQ